MKKETNWEKYIRDTLNSVKDFYERKEKLGINIDVDIIAPAILQLQLYFRAILESQKQLDEIK